MEGAEKEGGGLNLCAETSNPVLRGTKYDGCGRNTSVYHVYPVSQTTGEAGGGLTI